MGKQAIGDGDIMSHIVKRLALLAVLSLVMVFVATAVAAAIRSDDDPTTAQPADSSVLQRKSPDGKPFDPIIELLGGWQNIDAIRSQQETLASQEPSSPDRSLQDEVWREVEALYESVKATPEAALLRVLWRECMDHAGHDFTDPREIEEALDRGDLEPEAVDSALHARDRCLADHAEAVGELARDAHPAWVAANQDLLQRYVAMMGVEP